MNRPPAARPGSSSMNSAKAVPPENLAEVLVELCERPDVRGIFHWAGAELCRATRWAFASASTSSSRRKRRPSRRWSAPRCPMPRADARPAWHSTSPAGLTPENPPANDLGAARRIDRAGAAARLVPTVVTIAAPPLQTDLVACGERASTRSRSRQARTGYTRDEPGNHSHPDSGAAENMAVIFLLLQALPASRGRAFSPLRMARARLHVWLRAKNRRRFAHSCPPICRWTYAAGPRAAAS